jgi:hypothetical protein
MCCQAGRTAANSAEEPIKKDLIEISKQRWDDFCQQHKLSPADWFRGFESEKLGPRNPEVAKWREILIGAFEIDKKGLFRRQKPQDGEWVKKSIGKWPHQGWLLYQHNVTGGGRYIITPDGSLFSQATLPNAEVKQILPPLSISPNAERWDYIYYDAFLNPHDPLNPFYDPFYGVK